MRSVPGPAPSLVPPPFGDPWANERTPSGVGVTIVGNPDDADGWLATMGCMAGLGFAVAAVVTFHTHFSLSPPNDESVAAIRTAMPVVWAGLAVSMCSLAGLGLTLLPGGRLRARRNGVVLLVLAAVLFGLGIAGRSILLGA